MAQELSWHREEQPRWDADKQRIIGGAPAGVFAIEHTDGERLSGDWWHAADDDRVVGYGWLDIAWGDAEILLAVDSAAQRKGVGGFVLDNIEREAAQRGVNYVYNTIRSGHPQYAEVRDWLESHGFAGNDNDEALRKQVTKTAAQGADQSKRPAPVFDEKSDMPPGHEESGGYVNPEQHQY